jgi:ubiquinone/menaquinone biosynthesis C-methylase UbiE
MTLKLKEAIRNYVGGAGTGNAVERDLWIKAALSRLKPGTRLLDVGAGTQRYRTFCTHLHYVSQDFCQYDGKGDGKAIQTGAWDTSRIDIVSDILAIPAESGSFDAILCTEVLEHVPDPIAGLSEMCRLLRFGGELILTAPFCSIAHMAPYHYFSGFNKYFYKYHLPRLGMEITEIAANGDYSEYSGQEMRRMLTLYGRIPFYVRACIAVLLRFINLKRAAITASSDLLCYGYHVRAVKSR